MELSIVLVILGLLVGGVLGGQALIKAAEMRAVTTELNQWQTAVNSFRTRYMALPGDTDKATRFWTAAGTCPPDPASPPAAQTTCNGNGDGKVGYLSSHYYESFLFWQHLSLAGIVEGQFSGVRGTGSTTEHLLGVNAPQSRYPSGGWSVVYMDTGTTSPNQYRLHYGNSFVFGGQRATQRTTEKILTPSEAWSLDTKVDDGHPAQGTVLAHWIANACSAADDGNHLNTNFAAHYRLEDASLQCSLIFRNAF